MSNTPSGWLDVHGHFFLPRSQSEDVEMLKGLCEANFLVSEAPKFDPQAMIAYNQQANISMQMLSYLPSSLEKLRGANDFGISVARDHPQHFGLLAGLPTDKPEEALREIQRVKRSADGKVQPDGFAVTTIRNGVSLGNPKLRPVWQELNDRKEVIFVHPNAYAQGLDGRPSALIDVASDTARTITDMLYNRVFADFPHIKWIFAHSGGAFPAISGRVLLLGTQSWVPNPTGVTRDEMKAQMESLYFDTAATAATGMEPAIKLVGVKHIIYGSDCGVPCSTKATMEENRKAVFTITQNVTGDGNVIGMNGFELFPEAKKRASREE